VPDPISTKSVRPILTLARAGRLAGQDRPGGRLGVGGIRLAVVLEAIRVLRVARSSAIKARTQVANQHRDLLITGSEELHAQLWPLPTTSAWPT
jgi:hypothetical protein